MDTCCYNRPFDDLSQRKIKVEADAVIAIVELSKKGKILIASSQFVKHEIDSIKDAKKRTMVLGFYHCDEYHVLNKQIGIKAKYYQKFGLKTFDSLHLATAELAKSDFLLTTDADFIKLSFRFAHDTIVTNPYEFMQRGNINAALS